MTASGVQVWTSIASVTVCTFPKKGVQIRAALLYVPISDHLHNGRSEFYPKHGILCGTGVSDTRFRDVGEGIEGQRGTTGTTCKVGGQREERWRR